MHGTLRTDRLLLVPASLEELRMKFDGPVWRFEKVRHR